MIDGVITIDVENWYHILGVASSPKLSAFRIGPLQSRVEKSFKQLDVFDTKNVSVTCFFPGWVADRFPHLVKEASARGHEATSHGYAHLLVYEMTHKEFLEDALMSKYILEDITGKPVYGYRASGF